MSGEKNAWRTRARRPWVRWLLLTAGVLELCTVWYGVNTWLELSAVAEQISSPDAWTAATAQTRLHWAVCAVMAFLCLFQFATWTLPQEEWRVARREGLCLCALALCWGGSALLFPLGALPTNRKVFWAVLLLATAGGGAYSLWKSRMTSKSKTNMA